MAGMAVPWLLGAVLALLGSLPGAAGCPRACTCYVDTDVHCTFRYLHAVPPGLPGHVQRVNLGYNGILQLTEQSLPGLPHLEMLLLHSNSIQRLSGRVFQDLKSLTLLKLSHNKVRLLGREALRGLASLQRLHLDHNQLEFLHPEALVGLVSLRSLFLEGNRLRQLHRDSLVTFWLPPGRLLPASSLRQLHLSGNGLRSLPRGLFSSAGELEQVFLHDNPWACDCGLRWLLDWDRGGKELLKCKRERAQGGRLCPVCASPTANRGQELFTVPQEAVSCRRPSIASPLKLRNVSLWGDVGPDGPQGRPLGKVGLDLSDNGGNKGGLGCDALRPGGDGDGGRGAKLNVSEGRLSVRATIAVRLACAVEAGDMESLWRILAYYSDSPLVLRRERTFPGEREGSGPSYAQASDNGLGFFSGVRAAVSGDLPWLLDSEISLKLNRRLTSATKLYLDASVEIDVTYDLSDLPDKKSPWVMIGKEDAAESGLVVASGATLEIECQPWGFPNPGVLWTFPDGTRRPAPYDGPDGRVAVSADGTLTVRLAAASDRGVYRCVARADETSDAAAFRVEVVDGNVNERNANGAALTAARRQTLVLPCAATGSPDPEVAWVLPNKRVVRPSSSPSDGTYVTDNGTLVVPEVTEGGFYQCVAINKLGMERLVHKVEVTAASGEGGRVTNEIVESVETATPVASPTRARDELAAGRYIPREVTEGHVVTARAQLTTLGPSVATQGRREEPTSTTMETEDLDNNLDDDDDGDNEGERSVKTETKTLGSRNRPHSTLSRFGPGWWAKVLENVRNKISPRVRPTLSVLPHTKPPHTTSPARIEEKEEEEEEEEEKTEEEDNKDVTEEGGGRSRADDESTRGSDGRAEAENEESSADDVDVAVAKFNPNPTPQPPYPPTTRPGIVSVPRAVPSPPINRILTPEPLGEDSAMEPNYHLNSFSEGTDGQRAKWHDIRPTEKSETATAAHIEEEEEEKEEAKEEEEEATNSFHHEEMHTDRHHMQDPTARTASRENAARPYEPGVDELDGGGVVRDTFDSPRTDEPEAPTKSQAALPGDKRELAEATSVDGRTSSLGRHRPGGSEQPSSRGDSVETSKGGGGAGSEGGGMRTGAWGSAYDRTLGRSEEVERRYGPRMTHRSGETQGGAAGRHVEAAQPTQPTGKMDSGAALGRADDVDRSGGHEVETQAVVTPRPSHAFPAQGGRDEQSQLVGGASTGHVARMQGTASAVLSLGGAAPVGAPPLPAQRFPDPGGAARLRPHHGTHSASAPVTRGETGNQLRLGIAQEERPLHPGGVQGVNHSPRRTHNPITRKPPSRQFHPQQSWQEHHHRHSNRYAPGYSPVRYHPLLPKLWNFYPRRLNGAVTNRPEITALVAKPTPPPLRKVVSTELEDDRTRTFWNPLPPRPHSAPRVAVNSLGTTLTATERFENPQGGAGAQRSTNWHPSRRGSGNDLIGALTSEAKAVERPRQASPRSQLPNPGPRGGTRLTQQQSPTPPPPARLTPLRPGFARRFGATGSGGGGSDAGHARRTNGSDAGASTDVVLDRQGAAEEAPSVTAAAGADAFLPCGSVGGGGFVDVRWIRASTGSIVAFSSAPSGRRVAVLRDGTLAVRSASPGDADRYTCETPTGGGGTGGATVALRVESRPPRVLSPRWRELRVSLGGTAEAECAAQGSPPPAISWTLPDHSSVAAAAAHHGGGRVSVSERATLTVLDVRPSDRGDYSCVARSAAGTDAITVRLHVLPVGPTVVRGAAAVSVAAGRPLSLPCAASGWPEPAVSWALPGDGGRLLPDRRSGAGSGVRVFANGTLLVPAVTRHDAGTYRCAAANVVGVDSADVLVTVLGPPRVAAPPPADVAVPYGGALRLRCVAEGEPQPVVVWRLPSGGTASMWFAADRRVRVLPDGSLALDGAVASDAGRYVCTVRNRYGEDSAAAAVSVTMRPARIERHSGDTRASGGGIKQSVRHGADLRFDCVTSGWPRPHVSWSLPDGAVVPADSRARAGGDGGTAATLAAGGARRYAAFGNGTLALRGVGPADGGDYTCYAENAVGWDAMVVRVAVEGQAPQIQDKPERAVVRITSGGSVALECRASGDPAPLVTWRLPDGSQLPPPSSPPSSPRRPRSSRTPGQEAPRRAALSVRGEDSALEVRGARIADAGRYVCVARNAAGEDSRAVRLDVLPAPPSINGRAGSSPEIKDSVAQGARKLLPCAADGDPRPHVVWITPSGAFLPVPHSSGRLLTHADGSLEIRSAARSDAGRYVCVARGADGGGDARLSVDLTVTGAPAPPSFLAPTAERAEVALGGSVALACPARGEPPPRTTWTLPGGAQLARGGTRGTRFSAGLDGALLVRGATPADAGVYRCSSRGPNGAADRAVLLEVGPRPRIAWMSGGTVAALAGDALWLHCVVAAGRASWRLPSSITVEVPGASGRRTLFANGTLAVRDSLTRDGGAYVCTARGAAGAAADGESRTVRVVVVAQAPRIVDGPPPAMAVLRGAPLRLPCTASGAPGPEVGWELPDGARLSTGTPAMRSARSGRYVLAGGTLVVAAAAARDAGFYRCSARNAVGEEWRRTSVRVV
ncbi:matrix-remodeling-associated protein 5-like isoform X1 [Lethenteron reissneri]|uniref:matrix-remodeling-associated protein 5-like isoform X1 n=1 Tax=Lethenteron reissneri TaxID=7753 RepID=UPI002AB7CC3F|nr:matrix-remodeling-associated protein 5-like isoform X1 [Lethenteron reissneri]